MFYMSGKRSDGHENDDGGLILFSLSHSLTVGIHEGDL